MKDFTLTKKIAKHGDQSIIILPRFLKDELKPGTIIELDIRILKESTAKSLNPEVKDEST